MRYVPGQWQGHWTFVLHGIYTKIYILVLGNEIIQ